MKEQSRRRLEWILGGAFLFAMFMATGPGVLLVNDGQQIWGIPALYAWAFLWYGVILLIAALMFTFVWPAEDLKERHDRE